MHIHQNIKKQTHNKVRLVRPAGWTRYARPSARRYGFMKSLFSVVLIVFIPQLGFSEENQKYEESFKKVALLRTQAEYSNFVLNSFESGERNFKSKVSKLNLDIGKVWVKDIENMKYSVTVLPIDSKGSAYSMQSFNKNTKTWVWCEIGDALGGYELGPSLLKSIEATCDGDY